MVLRFWITSSLLLMVLLLTLVAGVCICSCCACRRSRRILWMRRRTLAIRTVVVGAHVVTVLLCGIGVTVTVKMRRKLDLGWPLAINDDMLSLFSKSDHVVAFSDFK